MKQKIENKFFDLIILFISFLVSIFRSFKILFTKNNKIKRGYFFSLFDFVFIIWPKYFWNKPSFSKILFFLPLLIKHLFYNNKLGK